MDQDKTTGAPVTPATPATQTPMPMANDKPKSGKGLKIATAIACIIAVCGIGFGVYGIITKNDNTPNTPSNEPKKETSSNTEDQELNPYEENDLKYKTLRLLGYRNGLSIGDYYDDGSGDFVVYKDYMPIASLINNELDDNLKTYITLETTISDKEKTCSYNWTDGVKADIDTALGEEASTISFGDGEIDCISYDRANDDYYNLWGETMPKTNGLSSSNPTGGDYAYGSNLDAYYYHIIGGRGGTCSNYAVGKILKTDKNQNYASVDINVGSLNICMDNPGELRSDIVDGEIIKTIEQDNLNWNNLEFADNDYSSFQSYRLTFKKNSKGIYSFSAIEKI